MMSARNWRINWSKGFPHVVPACSPRALHLEIVDDFGERLCDTEEGGEFDFALVSVPALRCNLLPNRF